MIPFYGHELHLLHKLNDMQEFYECTKCNAHFYKYSVHYYNENIFSTIDTENSTNGNYINYTMYPKFALEHYRNYGLPCIRKYSAPIKIMSCDEFLIKNLLE